MKKYLPLAIALVMAMGVVACDGCNNHPTKEEAQQPVVELIPSPDIIKGAEKGKVILKVKGVKWYNEVWLYCKNQSAFETEDGKSLQSPIELHTLLGKKNNEQVPAEGIEVPILIKASEETIQANKANETLLMSVGNATNAATYLSEQEVLTWERKAVPVITISAATIIKGDEAGVIVLKNTGDPIKKREVLLTWGEDYLNFMDEENNLLQEKVTLDKVFSGCTPEDMWATNEEVTIKVYAANKDADLKLKLSVGTHSTPEAYIPEQTIVTWNAVPVIILSDPIQIVGDTREAQITFINTGAPVKMSEVILKWGRDFNKFSDNERDVTFLEVESLDNLLCGYGVTPETIFESDTTLFITVHTIPEFTDDELKLHLSIGTPADSTAYATNQEVVSWREWE